MRTTYPLMVVVSIAIMVGVLQASGWAASTGSSSVADYQIDDQVANQTGGSSAVEQGVTGRQTSSYTTIDFVISGLKTMWNIGGLILFFPVTLQRLILPFSWAVPLGWGAEILVSIGLVQAAANRVWR